MTPDTQKARHHRSVINKFRSGSDLQKYISTMQKNPIILKVDPKNNRHK